MEFKSIIVALILLAVLFGWYAWLEAAERRRSKDEKSWSSVKDTKDQQRADADGELWKRE
jgi:nicotinamide riboside transporter PnuC